MAEEYYNEVKRRLKNKGKVSAAWLHMASNVSAEILANAGFDALVIDVEHSPVDYQTILSMCQAIKGTGALPFARAPWNDLIALKRISDCGVMGSPRACGYGMNRGHYLQRANDENLVMIAIETPEGIKNLPEIMKIEDLDGIFIGPMDLSTSMGMMGQFDREVFKAAIRQIEDIVLPSDKFLATVANDADAAQKLYDKGYNFVIMMSDAVDLSKMAAKAVETFKKNNPEVCR